MHAQPHLYNHRSQLQPLDFSFLFPALQQISSHGFFILQKYLKGMEQFQAPEPRRTGVSTAADVSPGKPGLDVEIKYPLTNQPIDASLVRSSQGDAVLASFMDGGRLPSIARRAGYETLELDTDLNPEIKASPDVGSDVVESGYTYYYDPVAETTTRASISGKPKTVKTKTKCWSEYTKLSS
jgi:hypothetical protein